MTPRNNSRDTTFTYRLPLAHNATAARASNSTKAFLGWLFEDCWSRLVCATHKSSRDPANPTNEKEK
jgi:hypothetical protein